MASRPTLRLNDGFDHTSPDLADEVRELQEILNQEGYGLGLDGHFGRETEMAVKRFQREHGLDDDGIVGAMTWAVILGETLPDPAMSLDTSFPRNDQSLLAQLAEANTYRAFIEEGARLCGVRPAVICGVGSRESRWGLALKPKGPTGTGDATRRSNTKPYRQGPLPPDGGGFGRGLMQIDYDAHEFARSGDWQNAKSNILYGCQVLKGTISIIERRTDLKGLSLLRAGIAGYNCGPGNVLKALQQGRDVDFFTAHRDYSRDALNRAGWFHLHGWD
ncbi:MAG: peptidoglycan-binding protein [Candidatus Hydrogenedentes bacterium]|nr:peptidoglycan-binding protein [Candidatus Hydrogenedentota bacterium]